MITRAPAARLDEARRGLHLRPHAAGRELALVEAALASETRQPRQLALPARAEVDRHARHAGEQHEHVGVERRARARAEQRSLSITAATPTSRSPPRATGMPPPPAAITSAPCSSSARTWSLAEHLARVRAGDHAAPAAPGVGRHVPAALARAAPRLVLVVERADRLRRRREGRVGRVDEHAREQRGGRHATDRAPRWPSAAGSRSGPASSRSARRAAAAGPRPRRASCCSSSAPTCGPLPCVSTTSWPARRSATSSRGDHAGVRELLVPGARLPRADQGIAPDRDDDAHRATRTADREPDGPRRASGRVAPRVRADACGSGSSRPRPGRAARRRS